MAIRDFSYELGTRQATLLSPEELQALLPWLRSRPSITAEIRGNSHDGFWVSLLVGAELQVHHTKENQ